MPIQVACPECGKKYRLPDERAGGTVDCKECGTEIDIPGGSRRRSKSRDDDDEVQPLPARRSSRKSGRKSKESGSSTGLLIAGGIGGVVIVGLLAMLLTRRPAAPPVANNGQPVAGNPGGPNGNPAAPNAAAGASSSKDVALVPVKGWKVKVDPPAVPVVDKFASFQIETKAQYGLNANQVLYPEIASPFALIGDDNNPDKKPREIWNLATGAKVRDGAPHKGTPSLMGLSPDGRLQAWQRSENGGGIDVYDTEAGKMLVSIPLTTQQLHVTFVALPSSQRLVAGSTVHHKLMTWKLPSGEAERTIELGDKAQPNEQRAFSPGGKFFACTGDFLKDSLYIIDLDTGERAGTIEFAGKMFNVSLVGLAFSPDGAELAAAYGQNNGSTSDRILIWNAATGAVAADFRLPDPDQRTVDVGGGAQSLQWFPGRKRLLQNGLHVIDREARRVVFTLPPLSIKLNTKLVRHVLTDSIIAAWEGTKDDAKLAPLELKESDIARAKEVAASGGLAIDAKLPKLTLLDRKRAPDKTTMDGAWKVQPDPCPNPATLAASTPLSGADGRVRELTFARLDSARAALRLAKDEKTTEAALIGAYPSPVVIEGPNRVRRRYAIKPVPCLQNWVELFDLAQGQSTGRVEIAFPCELTALSPDGSRVLVTAADGQGRLDAFAAADGAHVVGCRPFVDEKKPEHRDIEAAVFLDNNTVAACSRNDRLVVFKLPGCEPIYGVQDAGAMVLSPGGKLIATCAEGKVEFRDALSGDGRGSTKLDGEVVAMSFSSLGDRLAVLIAGSTGSRLDVIELKDGAVSSLSIPAALAPLLWVGEQRLLVGGERVTDLTSRPTTSTIDRHLMLVDLRRQAVLWSYEYGPGDRVMFGRATVDDRLWVAGAPRRGSGEKLTALNLPEATIAGRLDDKTLDAQLVVQPGMVVTLQLGLADPSEWPGFTQQARSAIDGIVRNNGLTVQDGQPLKLIVTATAADTPGTMELQLFGGTAAGQPPKVTVQRKKLSIRVAYESNGKTVWESKQETSNEMLGFVRIANQTAQQALDEDMWKRAADMLRRALPPSHVLSGATSKGLGTSRLAGDGAHPPG
ncbi:MAG: PQQ-binding-like beta-propeller repeat protein [Planctomycetota bacterium]